MKAPTKSKNWKPVPFIIKELIHDAFFIPTKSFFPFAGFGVRLSGPSGPTFGRGRCQCQ
jgi:hypothetical protein